jgi:hypothetical protein
MNFQSRTIVPAILITTLLLSAGAERVSAQSQASPDSHMRIAALVGRLRGGMFIYSVRCTADRNLTEGLLRIVTNAYGSKTIDTLTFWKGETEADTLDKTGHYSMPFEVGSKFHVKVIFTAQAAGGSGKTTLTRNLYAYRLSDTLLTGEDSYKALDKAELDHLIKKKGYEGKTEDEIKTLDPDLYKKMEAAKKE